MSVGPFAFVPPTGPVYQAARDPLVQLPLARRALARMEAGLRARGLDEAAIARVPSVIAAKARVERWS
jgi:hypothetical protein